MREKTIGNYNRLLEGKTVFVTTAARGIGKSIAVLFARQGAAVFFAGRNEAYVRRTEEELRLLHPDCRGYVCDLSNAEDSERTAAEAMRDSGGIDILVSTVGINCHCTVDNYLDEDMLRLLETNYLSGLRFARRFAPSLRARRGCVVNISSIHSTLTEPTNMLYAGTKGAMNAAARAMALDFAADGVRAAGRVGCGVWRGFSVCSSRSMSMLTGRRRVSCTGTGCVRARRRSADGVRGVSRGVRRSSSRPPPNSAESSPSFFLPLRLPVNPVT